MRIPRALGWVAPLVLGAMVGAALIRGVSAAPPSASLTVPPDLISPDVVVSTAIAQPPDPPHAAITVVARATTTVTTTPAPVITSCPPTGKPPVAIRIPSIGVSSRDVIAVGLNADRSLKTPPLSKVGELGWFQCSPVPGETGPSVVLAHDEQQGHHGLFWNLGLVKAGDTVELDRSDGQTAIFRVTQNMTVPKPEFDQYKQQVYGNTTDSQLRVITCSGLTSQEVVFADLVSIRPTGGH